MKLIRKIPGKLFKLIRSLLKLVSSRIFIIGISMLLQLAWVIGMVLILNEKSIYITYSLTILAVLAVFGLVNQNINPGYKLMWAILILPFPVVGVCLYSIFGPSRVGHKFREAYDKVLLSQSDVLVESEKVRRELDHEDPLISGQSVYLRDFAFSPLYGSTETEYYPIGEEWFEKFVEELKKAEHYIFMEYFIIAEGTMWNTVLEILKEKAKSGVDVRLIYDDFGCITTLPPRYYLELQSYGIQCASFNQFRPVLNVLMNNRDHRKITVIDGHTGFTGGINLADEYINKKERFGHWKDSGIFLHGEAVWSFTVMFLQMWSAITGVNCNLNDYHPERYHAHEEFVTDGFVQPYGDSPLDGETVGEHVYLNMISQSRRYVYIFTPYLIPDNETLTALCLAAKRGVDVRIVTPGIPDKKMVYWLTQSYYEQLLLSGVKIYQYSPGFIHSKSFVCDDEIATVGTINVDYRSLYLHFECGVWLYRSKAVMQVKDDALKTFEVCQKIDIEYCKRRNMLVRALRGMLKIFAPLL